MKPFMDTILFFYRAHSTCINRVLNLLMFNVFKWVSYFPKSWAAETFCAYSFNCCGLFPAVYENIVNACLTSWLTGDILLLTL